MFNSNNRFRKEMESSQEELTSRYSRIDAAEDGFYSAAPEDKRSFKLKPGKKAQFG